MSSHALVHIIYQRNLFSKQFKIYLPNLSDTKSKVGIHKPTMVRNNRTEFITEKYNSTEDKKNGYIALYENILYRFSKLLTLFLCNIRKDIFICCSLILHTLYKLNFLKTYSVMDIYTFFHSFLFCPFIFLQVIEIKYGYSKQHKYTNKKGG